MTWVGSADTEKYDQVLDSVLVGPVVPGQYRFVFQASTCEMAMCAASLHHLRCKLSSNQPLQVSAHVGDGGCRQMPRMEPSFPSRT